MHRITISIKRGHEFKSMKKIMEEYMGRFGVKKWKRNIVIILHSQLKKKKILQRVLTGSWRDGSVVNRTHIVAHNRL